MFVRGERTRVEQLEPLEPRELFSLSMSFPNQEGLLFLPLMLKKGKQQPGSVLPAATSPAQPGALSAHLRPVLACPTGASREMQALLCSPGSRWQEPSRAQGCPGPAPASCLQVQTTRRAQVSDALKTSRREAGPGAAWAWWSLCSLPRCGRPPSGVFLTLFRG